MAFGKSLYKQVAPPGFLLLTKFLISFMGKSEYVFRILPVVFALLSLPVYLAVTKLVIRKFIWQIIALIPFFFSPLIIYYASEFKSYSADLFFSLLISYLILKILSSKRQGSQLLVLSMVGLISPLFSFGSIFVFASGLTILAFVFSQRRWCLVPLIVASACWLVVLTMLLFNYFHNFQDQYFLSFFGHRFLTNSFKNDRNFSNLISILSGFADYFVTADYWEAGRDFKLYYCLLGTLFVIGLTKLPRKNDLAWIFLLLPFCYLILANALYLYPLEGRLLLFIVPNCILLMTNGLIHLEKHKCRKHRLLLVLLIFVYLGLPLRISLARAGRPFARENIRELMVYLQENDQKNEAVYIFGLSDFVYNFYSNNDSRFELFSKSHIPEELCVRNISLGKSEFLHERAWVLLTNYSSDFQEEYCLKNYMRKFKLLRNVRIGRSLALFYTK